jgi:hypothetical protein
MFKYYGCKGLVEKGGPVCFRQYSHPSFEAYICSRERGTNRHALQHPMLHGLLPSCTGLVNTHELCDSSALLCLPDQ